MKYSKEDYNRLDGELWGLQILANEVRLDCRRMGWTGEASLIQMMQDGIKAMRRARDEAKRNVSGDF